MHRSALDPVVVVNLLPKLSQYKPLLRSVLGIRGSRYNRRMAIFRTLFTFGLGVYAGLYAAQNYDVPRADDPSALLKKLTDYLEQFKKDK